MDNTINPVTLVDQSFYYIIGFSFVFLFAITSTMIFFVVRYRRSKNKIPSDIRGNLILETVWVVLPAFIALTLFVSGWRAYTGLRNVPEGALEIKVEAQFFSWLFYYPNEKETENEIVVPVNTPVKLNITSLDVIHSLYVPAFRIRADAVNGIQTYAWFLPEKEGEYSFRCTEFCGAGHSDMTGVIRVVPKEEYEAWVNKEDEW
jgi:cytochrome c oxidase subunit 2